MSVGGPVAGPSLRDSATNRPGGPADGAPVAMRHPGRVHTDDAVTASGFTLSDAADLVEAQPFCRWWGLGVSGIGDGSAVVTLPAGPHLLRPGGVLHGSCYEVVADVAMWLAIMTRTGVEPMAVTIEMKTSFLRGTAGDITGTARLLRLGRRVAFGEAEMRDGAGELVAHSTLSYIRPHHP